MGQKPPPSVVAGGDGCSPITGRPRHGIVDDHPVVAKIKNFAHWEPMAAVPQKAVATAGGRHLRCGPGAASRAAETDRDLALDNLANNGATVHIVASEHDDTIFELTGFGSYHALVPGTARFPPASERSQQRQAKRFGRIILLRHRVTIIYRRQILNNFFDRKRGDILTRCKR